MVTPSLRDSPATVIILAVGAVAVLALTVCIGIDMQRTTVTLTAEGLDYQGVGYRIRAAWPEVRFCDSEPPRLLLGEASFEPQGWMKILWPVSRLNGSAARVQAGAHIVHLKYYDGAWPDGRLAADLRRLAPGLLPPSL